MGLIDMPHKDDNAYIETYIKRYRHFRTNGRHWPIGLRRDTLNRHINQGALNYLQWDLYELENIRDKFECHDKSYYELCVLRELDKHSLLQKITSNFLKRPTEAQNEKS